MITIDDLQKIYKFGMDEAAHYYRCMENAGRADDHAYYKGAENGVRTIVEKIYLLMEREKNTSKNTSNSE